jgi:hypothetical protein
VCVCVGGGGGGLGSSGFCDQQSHCQMVSHYMMDIISRVGHSRSDSVGLLMVDGSVQWLGHRHCITGFSGQCQPC